VLQERTFHRLGGAEEVHSDFRLIAATNRDLAGAVYEDRFREDLYYRIAVFEITLPPLRDRGDDVLLIAHLLARDLGNQLRGEPSEIPPETDDLLRSYHWPGNVRELQNVLQRGIVLSSSPVIPPWALPTLGASGRRTERAGPEVASKIPVSPAGRSPSGTAGGPEAGGTDDQPEARSVAANAWDQLLAGLTLEEIERRAIESAIRRHGGNRTRAAEELGIARTTVYRKLEGS
jgi:DNA-binding NtrC family response regulator